MTALPTLAEISALKSTIGGHITLFNTPEHSLFQRIAVERGWLQPATEVEGGVNWKLSGYGNVVAFAD